MTQEFVDEQWEAELPRAAIAYLETAVNQAIYGYHPDLKTPPRRWPWATSEWDPSTSPEENLAKAASLVAAEIDRLNRGSRKPPLLRRKSNG